MRRLGFVGKTRLEAAQKLLPDALYAWHKQWCFSSEDSLIEARCIDEASGTGNLTYGSARWHKAESAEGSIWLHSMCREDWLRLLFAHLEPEVPNDQIAGQLIERAQQALVNAVLAALGKETFVALVPAETTATDVRLSSRVGLELSFSDSCPPLVLLLDAGLLDACLPAVTRAPTLSLRQDAIKTATVTLRLSLPPVAIPVGEIERLQPGDVLRTTTSLDQPLAMGVEGDDGLLKGYLARSGDSRAFQFIN